MDDIDLPPMPASARKPTQPPHPAQSSHLLRKRSRADQDDDFATSSDPALFSSDEQAPGAENYSIGKRKKKTYQGSWWSHQHHVAVGKKRVFKRNYDSGIFMGSETSDEALSSDSIGLEDEFLRDQQQAMKAKSPLFSSQSVQTTPKAKSYRRPQSTLAPDEHEPVRRIVHQALEVGKEDVDLSSVSMCHTVGLSC